MKAMRMIADGAVSVGAASLLTAVAYRVLYADWLGLKPRSFLFFSSACLLLGIALYLRESLTQKR